MVRAILEQFVELNKARTLEIKRVGEFQLIFLISEDNKYMCQVPVLDDITQGKNLSLDLLLTDSIISKITDINISEL